MFSSTGLRPMSRSGGVRATRNPAVSRRTARRARRAVGRPARSTG